MSAAGSLGGILGQMIAGGLGAGKKKDRNYYAGQMDAARTRGYLADAVGQENKNGYIQQAIDAGLAGRHGNANTYSLYGGNGKTSFQGLNNGAVLNSTTGAIDASNPIAQGTLSKIVAEAGAKRASGQKDLADAYRTRQLLPHEQGKLNAEAFKHNAHGQSYTADAYRTRELLPYEQQQKRAAANASNASANLSHTRAQYVPQVMQSQVARNQAAAAKSNRTTPQSMQPDWFDKERYKALVKQVAPLRESVAEAQAGLDAIGERTDHWFPWGDTADEHDAASEHLAYQQAVLNPVEGELMAIMRKYQNVDAAAQPPAAATSSVGNAEMTENVQRARQAIAEGYDKEAVMQRLRASGFTGEL